MALAEGQWWRVISGNFTHTNAAHLAMNLVALWLVCLIFKPTARMVLVLLGLFAGIIGLSLFFTDIKVYMGLSGVLHALFAFFALQEALTKQAFSWLLVLALAAKISYEQWIGASTNTEALIEARVAVDAHVVGSIAGLLLAGALTTTNKIRKHPCFQR